MHPFLYLLLFLVLLFLVFLFLPFYFFTFKNPFCLSFFLPFYFFTFLPLKILFSQNNKVKYHILKMLSQILCVILPTNQLNLNKQQ